MSKLVTEISVKDIDLVKNLIELLETHYDKLPQELKQQLNIISEYGINDITSKTLDDMFLDNPKREIKTNIYTNKILSINKVLRKVVIDEDNIIKTIYPVDFYLIVNDIKIVEWKGNIK